MLMHIATHPQIPFNERFLHRIIQWGMHWTIRNFVIPGKLEIGNPEIQIPKLKYFGPSEAK